MSTDAVEVKFLYKLAERGCRHNERVTGAVDFCEKGFYAIYFCIITTAAEPYQPSSFTFRKF